MTSRGLDMAILALGVCAVSTAAVLIREADAPAMVIAAYRLCLASLPLLLIVAVRRTRLVPADGERLVLTLLAGVFLALHFGFWVASVQQTSVVTSVVLVTTTPLFVGFAGQRLLGERPSRSIWLAIGIAATGAALMVAEDIDGGGDTIRGDVFALLGALFAAGYIFTGRRVLRGADEDWLPYVTLAYATAGLLVLAAAVVSGESLGGYSERTYVMLVALALVPQLIGHTAVNRSLGRLPAIVVSMAILGEPVGATVLAAVVLGEEPTLLQLLGGLVVLTGVAVGVRGDVRSAPVPATG
jgi:drug/metabolite transporter (DMT)-like permease